MKVRRESTEVLSEQGERSDEPRRPGGCPSNPRGPRAWELRSQARNRGGVRCCFIVDDKALSRKLAALERKHDARFKVIFDAISPDVS